MKANKRINIILFLISFASLANAQGWIVDENSFEKNWNVSFSGGPSWFMGEITQNAFDLTQQSNQNMGFSYGFDISKMILHRLHLGIDYRLVDYTGFNEQPDDLLFFTRYSEFNKNGKQFIINPIKLISQQESYSLFLKYNLPNFQSIEKGISRFGPYIVAGAGIGYTSASASYFKQSYYDGTNLNDPFFEKGQGRDPLNDFSFTFNLGAGINYQMSKRLFFSFDVRLYRSTTDLLNGVHNFDETLTPEMSAEQAWSMSHVKTSALYTNFSFGVSYYFNFEPVTDIEIDRYPWYENQYRSYYSKQLGSEHKWEKQRRYPFYQDKFNKKAK